MCLLVSIHGRSCVGVPNSSLDGHTLKNTKYTTKLRTLAVRICSRRPARAGSDAHGSGSFDANAVLHAPLYKTLVTTQQLGIKKNFTGSRHLKDALVVNSEKRGQSAEDSQPSRPSSSETSASSAWRRPPSTQMEATSAANCDQGVVLDDLRADNGDTKKIITEFVNGTRRSCEETIHNDGAASQNDAREENKGLGERNIEKRLTYSGSGERPPRATVPQNRRLSRRSGRSNRCAMERL